MPFTRTKLEELLLKHYYGGVRFGDHTVRISKGYTAHTVFQLVKTPNGLVLKPAVTRYVFHVGVIFMALTTLAVGIFIIVTLGLGTGSPPLIVSGIILGPVLLLLMSRARKATKLTREVQKLVRTTFSIEGKLTLET